MNESPKELTIPGFHNYIEKLIRRRFDDVHLERVLDAGAGTGAFSQRLKNMGYEVNACDLHSELFQLPGVEFRPANLASHIPWDDDTFDLLTALEVTEHIDGVQTFFFEVARVLKSGGYFLFSTPNILSLKSRLRFLLSGNFYSFPPLYNMEGNEVSLHITPLTLDQYEYRLRESGFSSIEVETDKWQRSSMSGLIFYPILYLRSWIKNADRDSWRKQNSLNALLGRKLIVLARKE